MDILIKSFNRPYCLERCIKSIYRNVEGEFKITVLDDGTPSVYLEKIVSLFPGVRIKKSGLYDQKTGAICQHLKNEKEFDLFTIPVSMWQEGVSTSSDIFLMMEDDNWFTSPIKLEEIIFEMKRNEFVMLTMSWQGNDKYIQGKRKPVSTSIEEIVPSIPALSKIIFMNKFNSNSILNFLKKIKVYSVLYKAGVLKNEYELRWPFYTIYLITSTFFRKDYWVWLWEGSPQNVDELYQLKRAAIWYEKNNSRYAKTFKEMTRTSYITSATGSFQDIDFDIFHFNYTLNEAWLNGGFDAMENYPSDYNITYIKQFLDRADDKKSTYENWLKWVNRFKEQYRNIGCYVDW